MDFRTTFGAPHDEEGESLLHPQPVESTTSRPPAKPPTRPLFGGIEALIASIVVISALTGFLFIIYQNSTPYAAKTEDFIRPLTDQRQYQTFHLSNGLQVLTISDPQATASAVALSLQAGSFADPTAVNGLAHFVEHLVFLGSGKYPELDSFSRYVSKNGGSSNAHTHPEETNFHFQISTQNLRNALNMFLHMFIDPIFSREWAVNEAAVVDAEYMIGLQKDEWRYEYALKVAANPKSPFFKFSLGNTETLIRKPEMHDIDVEKLTRRFFNAYYSPNLMSLVVIHNEDTDSIENLVKKEFSLLQNEYVPKPNFKHLPRPFANEYVNNLVQYLPVGNNRTATMVFCVDSSLPYSKNSPLDFIYTLLNYGGPGGLSSVLKKKGWIVDLTAGAHARQSYFELTKIAFTLTVEGLDHLPEIVQTTFGYIDLIAKQGLTKELFDQFARTSKYIFDYFQYTDDSDDTMEEASKIASNMKHYQTPYLLAGDKLLEKFNLDLTTRFLTQINPDNLMITVADPSFEVSEPKEFGVFAQEKASMTFKKPIWNPNSVQIQLDQSQTQTQARDSNRTTATNTNADNDTDDTDDSAVPMIELTDLNRYNTLYNLNYSINEFSSRFYESINHVSHGSYPDLTLPGANPYTPSSFDIVNSTCTGFACAQVLQHDKNNRVLESYKDGQTTVRHLMDRSFGVPFTTCYIRLNTAKLQTNTRYIAASGILGELVGLVLTEDLYQIRTAGHSVDFKPRFIKIEAFSGKFQRVAQIVLQQYKQTNYSEALFQGAREKFASSINQNLLDKPYMFAYEILKSLLLGRNFTIVEVQRETETINFNEFKTVLADMQRSAQVETLLYGNIEQDQSVAYGREIASTLGYQAYTESQLIKETVANIHGKNLVYRMQTALLKGSLSSVVNYYQDDVFDAKRYAHLKVLVRILAKEAFTYLRSQKKMGYIVALKDELTKNVMGLKVIVVGSNYNVNEIDGEIENFWRVAENILSSLTGNGLADIITSYRESLNYDSRSYRRKGRDLYDRISNEDYIFDLREKLIENLPEVNKTSIFDYFHSVVRQPRKLSVQLYSEELRALGGSLVTASEEYSYSEPELIQGEGDLSGLPRYRCGSD